FIREIIEAFRHSHFASLLRNLSEAEWRARIEEKGTVKLTDSLWKTFEQSFRKSSFWERRTLLEAWAPFSVFLPERTIELAKLAISLDEAPEDEAAKLLSFQSSTWRNMVDRVPMILKPIGIYHLKLQFEVFDLLAQLGKDWQFKVEFQTREDDGHPWSAIAAAANFAIDQPMESVGGVVRWLESRLEADWMSDLIDRRGGFLNLILHPIFKRAIERTYSEGMNFIFQTIPLSVANTAPMRDAAFRLIEEKIVPRSEIATLNVIPALNETAAFYKVGPDQHADRDKWKPIRLRAISLLDFCRSRWSSSFVQFAVWRALADRIAFEDDKEFVEAGKDVLRKIPRDLSLKIAFVTLDEGGHCRFDDDLDVPADRTQAREMRKQFPSKVARELRSANPNEQSLWELLNHFENESRERGYVPNWSPLLIALTDGQHSFAESWIARCLEEPESFLEGSIGTLLYSVNAKDPEAGDRLIADALRSRKENVRNSAMGMFRWSMHPPGKASNAVLRDLLGSTNQSVREPVLIAFCDPLSHGRGWTHEMVDAIPFDALNELELSQVVASLVSAVQFEQIELDFHSLAALFKRLELTSQIHNDPYPAFFRHLSEKSPRKTYEIIRNRIVRFENEFQPKKDYSFNPVVKELEPWRIPGLEQDEKFSEIVGFLVGKMRNLDVPAAHYWTNLFQAAVLMNQTDLGIESIRTWLNESKDFEETREVARIFNLRGSSLVFSHPAFVRETITHVLRNYPDQLESIYWALLPNTGMRSYSNGELDASCHWVIDEARKASAQFAGDSVLKPFFDFVIDREERDQQRNRESYQSDMLAMA
ncbi:MAG: hypothetical protein IT576_16520, partial [Verrucomicrobiales bacterium]|nr:hypothetical protein [Verrucomicrobiales bacterium]